MKVIVTGVAGFIGSHAAERFLRRGAQVIGLDNLSRPGGPYNLAYLAAIADEGQFIFRHCDVRRWSDVDAAFADGAVDVVIHEAGQVAVTTSVADPRSDFDANALGTLNVLEATRLRAPHAIFLFASTNKVYGALDHAAVTEAAQRYCYRDIPEGVDERAPLDFHSPYGCSKGCAEQYVREYHRIYGLKSVVFRQSCVYGPRQYGMEDQGWVAWFSIAAVLGHPITIFGDGKQTRDLLWIDDLIDLYLLAIDNIQVAAGRIYNAGGGVSYSLSILELLALLEHLLHKRIPYSRSNWRPGDQRIFTANCARARQELNWAPTRDPRRGVGEMLEWIRGAEKQVAELVGTRLLTPSQSSRFLTRNVVETNSGDPVMESGCTSTTRQSSDAISSKITS